jgi:predicted metal-dependent hydrolase
MNLFKLFHNPAQTRLPACLELRALMQSFDIHYLTTQTPSKSLLIENANQQLTFLGKPKPTVVLPALTGWLIQKARQHFSLWMHRLSVEKDLSFTGLSIRQQRTLWGSCTAAKRINLNYKLLFLPADLTEHILLHELCHTKHFNHSRAFWHLLETLDPDCHRHRQQLKTAHEFLPHWIKMG